MLCLHLVAFRNEFFLSVLLLPNKLESQSLGLILKLSNRVLLRFFELLSASILLLHLCDHRCDVVLKLLNSCLVLRHAITASFFI